MIDAGASRVDSGAVAGVDNPIWTWLGHIASVAGLVTMIIQVAQGDIPQAVMVVGVVLAVVGLARLAGRRRDPLAVLSLVFGLLVTTGGLIAALRSDPDPNPSPVPTGSGSAVPPTTRDPVGPGTSGPAAGGATVIGSGGTDVDGDGVTDLTFVGGYSLSSPGGEAFMANMLHPESDYQGNCAAAMGTPGRAVSVLFPVQNTQYCVRTSSGKLAWFVITSVSPTGVGVRIRVWA